MIMKYQKLFARSLFIPTLTASRNESKIHNPPVYRVNTTNETKCLSLDMKHKLVPCREEEMVAVLTREPLTLPDCLNPKVIIIGAGLAGLSAAQRLRKSGVKEVTILEAKSRPGGRIYSCKLDKTLVELGGEYIDGASIPNPVYQLAAAKRLIVDDQPRYDNKNGVFLTSCGRSITADSRVFQSVGDILAIASQVFDSSNDSAVSEKTVDEIFREEVPKFLGYYEESEIEDVIRMMNGIINEKRTELGGDLFNISAHSYGSTITMPGGRMRFKKGASMLIGALLKDIPKASVHYNKAVQTVRWSLIGKPYIAIKCCDGTEFTSDYVIVTVPLGFLKSQINSFFCPPLPEEKMIAVENLSVGHMCKIFLQYKTPFWTKNESTIRFAWTDQEMKQRHDWFRSIGTIEEVPYSNNTLKVTVGGQEVTNIESICESDVAIEFTNWLRDITGDRLIPFPELVARSQWTTDLFTSGAFSLPGVQDQCILANPIPSNCPPVIFFAGEATTPGQAGTMHGAMTSGVREADRILSLEIHNYFESLPKEEEPKVIAQKS